MYLRPVEPRFPRPHLVGESTRTRAALQILLQARALVLDRGWCQGAMADGRGRVSLHGAVATGEIEAEWARRVLRKLVPAVSIPAFNDAPGTRLEDVVRVLDRAIEACGGVPPPRPIPAPKRGGWRMSTGPTQSPPAARRASR